MHELADLGLVKSATVEVRTHSIAPTFKRYIFNGREAFFGFHPVVTREITIGRGPVEIFDLTGRDSTLFHYAVDDDEASHGTQFVESARLWFNSVWDSVAREYPLVTKPTLPDLVGTGPLLLDLDGPVCSIFAGYPAPRVAAELVALLDVEGVAVPPEVREEGDPLAVLRWVGETRSHDLTATVEEALCAAALHTASMAAPTPFGHEAFLRAHTHAACRPP